MADLGRASLIICLGLALYGLFVGAFAAKARKRRLASTARNALYGSFAVTSIAMGVLIASFFRRDFSNAYVAAHSNRTLPGLYTLSALWGGQEGSLLLWLFLLTMYSAAAIALNRKMGSAMAWVVPVLALVQAFFAFMVVAIASPFMTQTAPVDGAGLNASLQNPYMMAHPPFLYLGYVGLTVPFAFAMGALLSGRTDAWWIIATRRWTLLAWMFLGVGQLLGAHWAYEEIGWGGYYGWDPVENAALMPWLAATAFLHSVMIQEKKGMLRVWNMALVILTFTLSLFGTFLTRSGVVQSVHSFAKSPIGAWFVGFIAVVALGSTLLLLLRLPLLQAKTKLESAISREATFLYNNLLLVALALTVLWGVLFPIISQLHNGQPRTVGRPYYDFFLRSFGLPLLLLMGIGPLIAWRRASVRSLGKIFFLPMLTALAVGGALIAAGAGSSHPGLIAYTFSAFVLAAIIVEFARGTRARREIDRSGWLEAFGSLVRRNRRRYGGYVVHAAIVLLAIGVAGSSAYQTSRQTHLRPGQSMRIRNYQLTYQRLTTLRTTNAVETRAVVTVRKHGRVIDTLTPGKNQYFPDAGLVSNEVAIRSNWLTAEDLYLVADDIRPDGSVYFNVWVKPLVNLIWIGGIVFVLGSLIAMWPDAAEQRRLLAQSERRRALSATA